MSSLVGKVTAAVAAVQAETQLSLANLNFDFTLVKLEAPKEFSGVGTAISPHRKANAEEGTMHQTARRLGALFEGRLPPTTSLFKAYGTRVSEISKGSTANPGVTERVGIFERQLGADCSSIWAAVTSGPEAIAIHLLACMLARIFTGPEATAIWVELVEKQKQLIMKELDESMYAQRVSPSILAAQQEISRTDLGNWDSSARAWLQVADQARERQQKQLMLILNNAEIPISRTVGVFDSVMSAWKAALVAMDSLVRGIPQQVQEGAALLAISAWHLYPDLLVLGNKTVNVQQSDEIFGGTAILTIGLQAVRDSQKGVSWSLPLACLRFYGHPVLSTGTVGTENSRISMKQFGFVVLGSVISTWGVFGTSTEIASEWLGRVVDLVETTMPQKISSKEFRFHWLRYLDQTAQNLLDCDGLELQFANQLVALGRRNSNFVYSNDRDRVRPIRPVFPVFSLSNLESILPLMSTAEARIAFLRQLAPKLPMSDDTYIIRYQSPDDYQSDEPHFEFCTLIPRADTTKRTRDGRPKHPKHRPAAHTRWLSFQRREVRKCGQEMRPNVGIKSSYDPMLHECFECEKNRRRFRCSVKGCSTRCQAIEHSNFWLRHEVVQQSGEACLAVLQRENDDGLDTDEDSDANFAKDFLINLTFEQGTTFQQTFQELKDKVMVIDTTSEVQASGRSLNFRFVMGDLRTAAIFKPSKSQASDPMENATYIEPSQLKEILLPGKIDSKAVSDFLREAPEHPALKFCAAAADLYKLMPEATISTKVFSQHILCGKWTRWAQPNSQSQEVCMLSRRQAFACIAMLDTGTCNLDPDALKHIFAMSSGNSIYVAGSLLCDPYERTEPNEIRRFVGNIGRAGISLLMSPPKPEIRERELENWKQINHYPFRGISEDNFQETTVHLSFTGYDMPLMTEESDRYIDRPANLVETLVSVHEKGKWVADLDIFLNVALPQTPLLKSHLQRIYCEGPTSRRFNECKKRPRDLFGTILNKFKLGHPVCADNWDEVLEAPKQGVIFARAHDNWLARFALTYVCRQLGFKTLLLPSEPCWPCCAFTILDRTNAQDRVAVIY